METTVKYNLVIYRHSLFDLTWPGFNSLQIRAEAPGRDLAPLMGGAYLAGEQLLLHAVLHGLWPGSSGSYQAPLGFLQPQLQLADSLQAHMEDTFTRPGPSWARLLGGLGHKHNTPGWTSVLQGHRCRAWREGGGSWAVTVAVTLPEPVVALIFKQILPSHTSSLLPCLLISLSLFPSLLHALLFLFPLCSTHLWQETTSWSGGRAPVTATLYHRKSEREWQREREERKEASGCSRGGAEAEERRSWASSQHKHCVWSLVSPQPQLELFFFFSCLPFCRLNYEHFAPCKFKLTMHQMTEASNRLRIWCSFNRRGTPRVNKPALNINININHSTRPLTRLWSHLRLMWI